MVPEKVNRDWGAGPWIGEGRTISASEPSGVLNMSGGKSVLMLLM